MSEDYTRGPWWTDTEGHGDQKHNVICASLGAHGTQVIVDDLNAGYLLDPDERYANAALIVRSVNSLPALVKALEEIVDVKPGMVMDDELKIAVMKMRNVAICAIAAYRSSPK